MKTLEVVDGRIVTTGGIYPSSAPLPWLAKVPMGSAGLAQRVA